MVEKIPTFQFWDTVLRMELMGLTFVRAHCEANFPLYVESLRSFVSWFFAFDHYNYARWVLVHLRDMELLTIPKGRKCLLHLALTFLPKGPVTLCYHVIMKKLTPGSLVHLVDALENGCNTCLVRTVDTDVVVIIIGKFHHLLTINPSARIWVAFGEKPSPTWTSMPSAML